MDNCGGLFFGRRPLMKQVAHIGDEGSSCAQAHAHTHTVLKKQATITQTRMHVCARTRAHIGSGHETKAVKTKAEAPWGGVHWCWLGEWKSPRGESPRAPLHMCSGIRWNVWMLQTKTTTRKKKVQKRRDNVLVHPKARVIANVHLCVRVCASPDSGCVCGQCRSINNAGFAGVKKACLSVWWKCGRGSEGEGERDRQRERSDGWKWGGGGLKREEKPIFPFFFLGWRISKMNVFHWKRSFLKAELPSIILPANEHMLIHPSTSIERDVREHGARELCLPHVFTSLLHPFYRQNNTHAGQLIGSVVGVVGVLICRYCDCQVSRK